MVDGYETIPLTAPKTYDANGRLIREIESQRGAWLFKFVKPISKKKKNFFYHYETLGDGLQAAKMGEIPDPGVHAFFEYVQLKSKKIWD